MNGPLRKGWKGIVDGMITLRASFFKRLWTACIALSADRLRAAETGGGKAGGMATFRDLRSDGVGADPATGGGRRDGFDRRGVFGDCGRVDDSERAVGVFGPDGVAGFDRVFDFTSAAEHGAGATDRADIRPNVRDDVSGDHVRAGGDGRGAGDDYPIEWSTIGRRDAADCAVNRGAVWIDAGGDGGEAGRVPDGGGLPERLHGRGNVFHRSGKQSDRGANCGSERVSNHPNQCHLDGLLTVVNSIYKVQI